MSRRIDDLQYKGLKIIQDSEGFCFGVDAVLLANMAKTATSKKTIDLCSGNGIVALLLAGKTQTEKIYALELQQKAASLAKESVELNNLSERVNVICDDLKNVRNIFERAEFDVVTCNPPYMKNTCGITNDNDALRLSRHEIACTLEDVIDAAAYLLKPGGKLFMVHRPERLVDIFCSMRERKIEPKYMQMVHPNASKKPNIVLVEGTYMGGRELKMLEPIYVYDENGKYTKQIDSIYERGCDI